MRSLLGALPRELDAERLAAFAGVEAALDRQSQFNAQTSNRILWWWHPQASDFGRNNPYVQPTCSTLSATGGA